MARRPWRSPLSVSRPCRRFGTEPAYKYNDAHFHLTNYIQEGTPLSDYVEMMDGTVKRSTVFGIPLQQMWDYENTGDFAPTYYLQTDAPLYYYSFTDAFIAMAYKALPADQQARLDPMITGFNPVDMYAVDHITPRAAHLPRRLLRHRRVQHPQGVRLLQDRGRRGQSERTRRSTACSISRGRPVWSSFSTTTSTCPSRSRARSPTW